MLKTTKRISITGESVIDNKVVCAFSATIETEDPTKNSISQFVRDKEAYRAHSAECRADYAAFEDYVWEVQDALKAEIKNRE